MKTKYVARAGVQLVGYSRQLGVQIPKGMQLDGNWLMETPVRYTVDGNCLVATRGGKTDHLRKVNSSIYLPISNAIATELGWEKGQLLLLTATEKTLAIKVPTKADFAQDNLYESWLFIQSSKGLGSGAALTQLGERTTGKPFTAQSLKRWRDGGTPPAVTLNAMINDVLDVLLEADEMDKKSLYRAIALPVSPDDK